METRDTLGTKKLPQANKQNRSKVSKILLGMLALSTSLAAAGYGCSQQKKAIDKRDENITGVLIGTKIDNNHVVFWLNTDNNPQTIEAHCHMPNASDKKVANISTLTNGTTKSLAEWRKLAHPYELSYCAAKFPASR